MSAKAITTKISCWFNHNVFTTLTYRPFYNALKVMIKQNCNSVQIWKMVEGYSFWKIMHLKKSVHIIILRQSRIQICILLYVELL